MIFDVMISRCTWETTKYHQMNSNLLNDNWKIVANNIDKRCYNLPQIKIHLTYNHIRISYSARIAIGLERFTCWIFKLKNDRGEKVNYVVSYRIFGSSTIEIVGSHRHIRGGFCMLNTHSHRREYWSIAATTITGFSRSTSSVNESHSTPPYDFPIPSPGFCRAHSWVDMTYACVGVTPVLRFFWMSHTPKSFIKAEQSSVTIQSTTGCSKTSFRMHFVLSSVTV
jgi:hypothetical protein